MFVATLRTRLAQARHQTGDRTSELVVPSDQSSALRLAILALTVYIADVSSPDYDRRGRVEYAFRTQVRLSPPPKAHGPSGYCKTGFRNSSFVEVGRRPQYVCDGATGVGRGAITVRLSYGLDSANS